MNRQITGKDEIVSGKAKYLLIVVSLAVMGVIAACSEEQVPTQEPVEFSPTEAVAVEPSGSQQQPAPPAPDESGGDAVAGRELFDANCTACHLTSDEKLVGPGLAGVYERAATQTSLDADGYIEQSLRDPAAYVVDTFSPLMPSFDRFNDDEVKNLIAYLKTLK